jgi:hypothetical protein
MSFLRRNNRPRHVHNVRLTLERLESLIVPAPLPPTNLTAVGASASSIALNWDASTDPSVTGYNVYEKVWIPGTHPPRGSGSGGHYVYNIVASNVPTNSDTIGVTAGSTHTYLVSAIDPSGTSPYSQLATGTAWNAPTLSYGSEIELSSGAVWSGPVNVQAGGAVQVQLLDSGNPLNYSVATGPSTVSIDQHGVITYTPGADEVGLNTFTFNIFNALGTVQQQVQFNVTATDPSLLTPTINLNTAGPFTYNTYSQSVSATALGSDGVTPVNGSMTITYNGYVGTPINAGTYNLLAAFTSSDPNYGPAYASGTMTIGKATPNFNYLSDQTFTVGASTVTVTGYISAGGAVPNAEYVDVALNGQVVGATVGTGGSFSATFATASLPVGTYEVDYYYAGDANLTAAPMASSTINVIPTQPPQVTLNPVNHTLEAPDPVSFSASATGSPNPTCQWQISTDGGVTYTNITNATNTTYTISSTNANLNGDYFRAVFSNGVGSPAITTAAKLTIQYAPYVTTTPADVSVVLGQSATFTAAVSANPSATVQWQKSVNGGAFANITNAKSLSYTFTPTAADAGDQFRAVFTNDVGSVTTSAATLSIVAPVTVASVQVNDGTAQRSQVRSISVTFSGPVTFANNNAAAAFTLTHLTNNNAVLLAANTSTDSQGRTVVTLTFSGSETDPLNGANPSLADGRYSLGITAASVFGPTGATLDGDADGAAGGNYISPPDNADGTGLHLFRLYGDIDGSATVNAYDFGQFRLAYGTNSADAAYAAAFDADGSGAINAFDYGQFRLRYGSSV